MKSFRDDATPRAGFGRGLTTAPEDRSDFRGDAKKDESSDDAEAAATERKERA